MADVAVSTLDDNGIIYVSGRIDEEKAKTVITKLFKLECSISGQDILMIIDSYGGTVDSFMAIHDAMKMIRSPVATLCLGKAMSCGQMLLISGEKGKRYISPHSRILMHQLWTSGTGTLTEVKAAIDSSENLQKIIESMICQYTKLNKKKLQEFIRDDKYFTAKEAVEYGFADKIATSLYSIFKTFKRS